MQNTQESGILTVVVMGLVTVFVVLICIILIIQLTSYIINTVIKNKEPDKGTAAVPISQPAVQQASRIPAAEKQQLVAVMASAIAQDMGTDVNRLRIHSIRRVGQSAGVASPKQEVLAAISVAVAESMGTDVSHLRIHSIRRI